MKTPRHHVSTFFLRVVLLVLGMIVLALCIFALPEMWQSGPAEFPTAGYTVRLIVIGMYVTAVPFFIALWQTFRLLSFIDRNTAFSHASVRALSIIKSCAVIIAVLYVAGVPLLFPIAQADDAPGLMVFGMVIACAPVSVAVFAAVLQRLLQNAIAMKEENDLTI